MTTRHAIFLFGALLLAVVPQDAGALGQETFGTGPLGNNYEEWPGLFDVLNSDARVYANWVNGNEQIYFRGKTDALNESLERFAAVKMPQHEVVLLPGPGEATTFDGKKIPCDWMIHVVAGVVRQVEFRTEGAADVWPPSPQMTVYVEPNIKLKELTLPTKTTAIGLKELRERYSRALSAGNASAAHFLARVDPYNPESAAQIGRLLGSADSGTRASAAGALGRMRHAASAQLPLLFTALSSEDHYKEIYEKAIKMIQDAPEEVEKAEAYRECESRIERFLNRPQKTAKE